MALELRLPPPGVRIHLSPEFNPPILKGVTVYPNNPFKFDFILDQGDFSLFASPKSRRIKRGQGELKNESSKLVKYFLASITTPENDLWVTH